jgi:hypothetical protein
MYGPQIHTLYGKIIKKLKMYIMQNQLFWEIFQLILDLHILKLEMKIKVIN